MEKKGNGKKRKLGEGANGAAKQLSEEHLQSLLEPLTKEQLISLLVNALSEIVSEMTRVEGAIANLEDDSSKKTTINPQSNEDEYCSSRV